MLIDSIIVSTLDVYLPTVNFDIPHLEYLITLQGYMRILNIQGKDLTFHAYINWHQLVIGEGDPNSHDYNKLNFNITSFFFKSKSSSISDLRSHLDF